jgi:cytochrome c-type biogenesis protein CcmF
VAAAFAVLWGTIYPIIAEVFTGVRLSIGPPFFNSVFVPLGLAIIGLTGIGPLISWRRMSKGAFTRVVRLPIACGLATAVALTVAGLRSAGALLAFSLCAFTAVAIGSEFARGSAVYRRRDQLDWGRALSTTIARNRRRYGGYIVHLGVVLIVIGIAGSAFRTERHSLLDVGSSMAIGDYTLTYADRNQTATDEKQINVATIEVTKNGEPAGRLFPQRNFHLAQGQPQSEVAIRTGPVEDLYVVITSFDADGGAAIRAFVNPLTWWIWVGAAVMLGGMTVLLSSPAPVRVTERVRRERREPAAVTR